MSLEWPYVITRGDDEQTGRAGAAAAALRTMQHKQREREEIKKIKGTGVQNASGRCRCKAFGRNQTSSGCSSAVQLWDEGRVCDGCEVMCDGGGRWD